MRRRDRVCCSSRTTCTNFLRKGIRFLLSNVGLTCLIVCYSILGGIAFKHLESPSDQDEIIMERLRASVSKSRQEHFNNLWEKTVALNVLNEAEWIREANHILKVFREDVINFTGKGWDGRDEAGEPTWSFARALLYSVSVITTIGYGDVTPDTDAGRIITIIYALFGIPLMLICLGNNGKLLAGVFRLLYRKVNGIHCPCPFYRNVINSNNQTPSSGSRLARVCGRRRSSVDKMVDTRVVNTDTTQAIPREGGPDPQDSKHSDNKRDSTAEIDHSEVICPPPDLEEPDSDNIIVPVKVSLLIMAIYVLTGGMLFSIWEEWNYLESSYFCFITLSTIGIGDYVPETSSELWKSSGKRLFCTLYLLFGLTVLAMCFDLMQDRLRKAGRWVGLNIGFLDS